MRVDINISDDELMALAEQARDNAYCPYSGYAVGAALLCADGTVYLGTNVENASFGATVCAERASAVAAVGDGHRDFVRMAIAGGKQSETPADCTPCGICRQFLSELVDTDFLFVIRENGATVRLSIDDVLPHPFNK